VAPNSSWNDWPALASSLKTARSRPMHWAAPDHVDAEEVQHIVVDDGDLLHGFEGPDRRPGQS